MKFQLILIGTFFLARFSIAQQSAEHSIAETKNQIEVYKKFVSEVSEKANNLAATVDQKSAKLFRVLSNAEEKIRRKVSVGKRVILDSLLGGNNSISMEAFNADALPPFKEYIPHLDSLKTSLQFLKSSDAISKLIPLGRFKEAEKSLRLLEEKFSKARAIEEFIKKRQQALKQQLINSGIVKHLRQYDKRVYYYSQQIKEYKTVLQDPKKIETTALHLLQKLPAFQEFMKKHSQLASLFHLPGNYGSIEDLNGLQARADVLQMIQQRVDGGGIGAESYLQSSLQDAQGQMNHIKAKFNELAGNNNNVETPDFRPNNQKTKSFTKRLELGTNFQSKKSNNYFPTTTDIGISIGYKLNDKSIAGIGMSYKLGLGKDISHIRLSHEGIGFRSFLDVKLKGSFYVSGGMEYEYRSAFENLQQLNIADRWQRHALLGLSKNYRVSKKVKGELKLLYDFLYKQHVPYSQPVVFRLGYKL